MIDAMMEILTQENITYRSFAGIVEGTLESIVEGICNKTCEYIFYGKISWGIGYIG